MMVAKKTTVPAMSENLESFFWFWPALRAPAMGWLGLSGMNLGARNSAQAGIRISMGQRAMVKSMAVKV